MTSTTVVVLPVPGGPWISPTSRADSGELHGLDLRLVERAVERAHGRIDAEFRLPLADEHVAKDRRHGRREARGPVPARPAAAAVATSSKAASSRQASKSPNSSGRPSRATRDRRFAPLADYAAIGKFGAILDAARAQRGCRRSSRVQGNGDARTANKLNDVPPAQAGDFRRRRPDRSGCCRSSRRRRARAFAIPPRRGGPPRGFPGPAAAARRPKWSSGPARRRSIGGNPRPHAAIAEHLPIQRLEQPRFPAIWHFDDGGRPAKLDPPYAAAIESAGAIEKIENLRFGRAARQWFDVEQRHEVRILWRGKQRGKLCTIHRRANGTACRHDRTKRYCNNMLIPSNTAAEARLQEQTELLKSVFGRYEKPRFEDCIDGLDDPNSQTLRTAWAKSLWECEPEELDYSVRHYYCGPFGTPEEREDYRNATKYWLPRKLYDLSVGMDDIFLAERLVEAEWLRWPTEEVETVKEWFAAWLRACIAFDRATTYQQDPWRLVDLALGCDMPRFCNANRPGFVFRPLRNQWRSRTTRRSCHPRYCIGVCS